LRSASASAQNAALPSILPSKTYAFDDLKVNATGTVKLRPVFDGLTHASFPVECHLTELPGGGEPHPPHRHVHEEMILIKDGTMEVTISGKKAKLGPGSVAYVASNEEHGWRNVGTTRALYFIVSFGGNT